MSVHVTKVTDQKKAVRRVSRTRALDLVKRGWRWCSNRDYDRYREKMEK